MKILLLITLFFFQSSHLLWAQTNTTGQPKFYSRDSKTRAVELKAKLREIEYRRRFRQQELENQRLEIEYQRQLRQQELENQRREIEVRLREFENQRREVEGRLQECENQLQRLGAIRESQPGLQQFEIPKSSFVFSGDKMAKLDKGGSVSLEELIAATLAQADALAKLLIEKGLITEAEFMQNVSAERALYQPMLQKISMGH
jgi:hypothetical protein